VSGERQAVRWHSEEGNEVGVTEVGVTEAAIDALKDGFAKLKEPIG
jgi:hypothetical protein